MKTQTLHFSQKPTAHKTSAILIMLDSDLANYDNISSSSPFCDVIKIAISSLKINKDALCNFYDTGYGLVTILMCGDYAQKTNKLQQAVSVAKQYKAEKIILDTSYMHLDDDAFADTSVCFLHASYEFLDFKTEKKNPLAIEIVNSTHDHLHEYIKALHASFVTCKNLANSPSNIMTPTEMANRAQKLFPDTDSLSVKVIDESEFHSLGMHSFLSVSKGSKESGKLILLNYQGSTDVNAPVYALVGKGVTFDTGGISLKPPAKMDEMKYDMCGAATVIATMQAVSMLKLPINLVVACACAENMPSDCASKPGDIVKSLSGKTIEILNTDAEGRLVLCDTMTYVQQNYQPKIMIDVATLTGACIIALGHRFAALFSNDKTLATDLQTISEKSNDYVWQLPLDKSFHEQLKSPFADIANIGNVPAAQSVVAACFLEQFCEKVAHGHILI